MHVQQNTKFRDKNLKIMYDKQLTNSMEQVLLEKLRVPQLVKKFCAFYGTRRFVTAFTRATVCPYPELH
jgi:hypothetical protein